MRSYYLVEVYSQQIPVLTRLSCSIVHSYITQPAPCKSHSKSLWKLMSVWWNGLTWGGPWKAVWPCTHKAFCKNLKKTNQENKMFCDRVCVVHSDLKKQRAGFNCRIYFISIWPICTQSIASHLLWYKIFLNFQHKVIIWENAYWPSVVRLDEKKCLDLIIMYLPCCAWFILPDLKPHIFLSSPPNLQFLCKLLF